MEERADCGSCNMTLNFIIAIYLSSSSSARCDNAVCTLQGQFCEQCAGGYSRSPSFGGPFATCTRCLCYNHESVNCDRETSVCQCTDNTTGPQCEQCLPGFYGNAVIGRPSIASFQQFTSHFHHHQLQSLIID